MSDGEERLLRRGRRDGTERMLCERLGELGVGDMEVALGRRQVGVTE